MKKTLLFVFLLAWPLLSSCDALFGTTNEYDTDTYYSDETNVEKAVDRMHWERERTDQDVYYEDKQRDLSDLSGDPDYQKY